MPITFMCPLCRHKVRVSRKYCGRSRGCPSCREKISVPELKNESEADEDSDALPDEDTDPPPHSKPGRELKTPSAGRARTPSAARTEKSRTPSAARTEKARTPSAARTEKSRTPSAARTENAAATPRDRTPVLIIAGLVLGLILLAGTVFVLTSKPPTPPPPPATEVAAPAPKETPVTAVAAPERDLDLEAAQAVVRVAERLEREGKELEAEQKFESALAVQTGARARLALVAGERALVDRCKEQLDAGLIEVRLLARQGDVSGAQRHLDELYAHVPRALEEELHRATESLNDELVSRAPRPTLPPKVTSTRPGAGSSKRPAELDRLEKLAVVIDDALPKLDAPAARRALDAAGSFEEEDIAREVALVRCYVAALDELLDAVRANAMKRKVELSLPLRKGAPAKGAPVRFADDVLTLEISHGAERAVELRELSARGLELLAGKEPTSKMLLALGLIAMTHGDYPLARETLARSTEPAAGNLIERLDASGVLAQAPEKPPEAAANAGEQPAQATVSGHEVTERWPSNGKIKARYSIDSKKRRHGPYLENTEDGKPRVKARYDAGELAGEYLELHPGGKTAMRATYVKGRLEGEVVTFDATGRVATRATYTQGKLLFTKRPDEIDAELASLESAPVRQPGRREGADYKPLPFEEQARGLKRLRAYRYLCGVPWDVELDSGMGEVTTAASQLLELVGHLEHTPQRPPGCSDLLYRVGYEGTSHSNLFQSDRADVVESVDAYMDDSDSTNVGRVGHRRWCLNPPMKVTAFGAYKRFSAMYAHDTSRDVPTPERVAYPAAGYFPARFAHHDLAWSVSLDAERFVIEGDVKVTVSPADERYRKLDPLPIEDLKVNDERMGMPLCIIFRPKGSVGKGSRIWVEIAGVKDKSGQPVPIEYFVELY